MGVTPHQGARESCVQGEAPESGGSRSRATNRMRIWGKAPGEAGERRTDSSPPGVSRGMVKAICPVLTGRMGKRTWIRHRALSLPTHAHEMIPCSCCPKTLAKGRAPANAGQPRGLSPVQGLQVQEKQSYDSRVSSHSSGSCSSIGAVPWGDGPGTGDVGRLEG